MARIVALVEQVERADGEPGDAEPAGHDPGAHDDHAEGDRPADDEQLTQVFTEQRTAVLMLGAAPTAAWVVAQPLTSEWASGGTTNTQRKNPISESTTEVAST